MYIVGKYAVIQLYQADKFDTAARIADSVLFPTVDRQEPGIRGDWFRSDFGFLNGLLSSSSNSSNCYRQFDLSKDVAMFWASTADVNNGPLFATALRSILSKVPEQHTGSSANIHLNAEPPQTSITPQKHFRRIGSDKSINMNPVEATESGQRQKWSASGSDRSRPQRSSMTTSSKEALVPKNLSELETANFALAAACGPSIGMTRVLAVQCLASTGQFF